MRTLTGFALSGRLGVLCLGLGSGSVLEALGEPDDVSVSSNPTIWKYGSLEVTLGREQGVIGIAVEVWQTDLCVPRGLEVESDLTASMQESDVLGVLTGMGGHLKELAALRDGTHSTWKVVGSSVQVAFRDGHLWGLGIWSLD